MSHSIVDRVLSRYFLYQSEIKGTPTCASTPALDPGRIHNGQHRCSVLIALCTKGDDPHRLRTNAIQCEYPLNCDLDGDLWCQPEDRSRKVRYRVGCHRV